MGLHMETNRQTQETYKADIHALDLAPHIATVCFHEDCSGQDM
jgi:hypothetical protein